MTAHPGTSAIDLIQTLFEKGTAASLSDAQLAERFVESRDHEAFAALVGRHGPMVMAVCRGLLGPVGDADDAFQATFVILLNRLGTFPVGQSLGGWLYRVARRVSRQARVSGARRRRRESAAASSERSSAESEPDRAEIINLIRHEVDLLPERYRVPIVLCDLQGMTRDEAAERLGCPAGTVGGRLARGRQRLRERLERRGIEPSSVMPIPAILGSRFSLEAAIRSASALGSGTAATPAVLALVARSTRVMTTIPVKAAVALTVAVCLAVGMVAAGRAVEPPVVATTPSPAPAPQPKPAVPSDPDDPKLVGRFVGRVVGPNEEPLFGARVFLVPKKAGVASPGPVRALSGLDGRFEFDAPDIAKVGVDGLPERREGLLFATADGYAADSMTTWGQTYSNFHSHMDPIKGGDLTLRLVRDDVTIRGRLLDPQGQPLAGAKVRVIGIQVPHGNDLDAHLKPYRAKAKTWFSGWCHDDPVALVGFSPTALETSTDADGRFKLAGLGRDRLVTLAATAPGVVETSLLVMTRDEPDLVTGFGLTFRGANFTLELKAGRTVTGVVRDRETHALIAGMRVGPRATSPDMPGTGFHSAVTGADGRFTITGLDLKFHDHMQAWPEPGVPYHGTEVVDDGRNDFEIELTRGIPFRITLVDETGAAIDASVGYRYVWPNPYAASLAGGATHSGRPLSDGAPKAKGVYEGFVLPGPGAVLVKTVGPPWYNAGRIDPKTFFAPGRTDWTSHEQDYGTLDTLSFGGTSGIQTDYAAIVLVNPPVGSGPLALKATLVRDRPRNVTLLDTEGKPVVGVHTDGMSAFVFDSEPTFRSATFPIWNLHADRARRITFMQEKRKLIGVVMAKRDGETPYVVTMQPWATLTGRILDENGNPLNRAATLATKARSKHLADDDFGIGTINGIFTLHERNSQSDGRFRIERLVPGHPYSADVYRGIGLFAGPAFENVTLKPGEVRDLGDIRTKAPIDVRRK